MGLFDIFKGGFAFNKMAKAYKEVFDCLGMYKFSYDVRYVYKAAWIFSNCILASIDKWHWNMFAGIMIPDYSMLGRITVQEANLIVMGKISSITEGMADEEQSIVEKILDGQKLPEIESLVSLSVRKKLLP